MKDAPVPQLLFLIALVAGIVYLAVRTIDNKHAECEAKGGTLVDNGRGRICIRAEVIP